MTFPDVLTQNQIRFCFGSARVTRRGEKLNYNPMWGEKARAGDVKN